MRETGEQIALLNEQTSDADEQQKQLLLGIPNLPHANVPVGKAPSDNPVLRSWGEKPDLKEPLDHVAVGTKLKLFDLERAAKLSGSGFICFTGAGARLERALIQFMLDLHTREHGYLEMNPPFLVRRECMIGTAQLPKFEENMGSGPATFLAPTAEVLVTNFHLKRSSLQLSCQRNLSLTRPVFAARLDQRAGDAGIIRSTNSTRWSWSKQLRPRRRMLNTNR